MVEALLERIAGRRDELVELARELIRFPTVNPPGEAYEPCARHLGERLARAGFDVQYLRAKGAIGDSERFPRMNVIARREGARPGPCVHFNGHLDVVETGHGWSLNAFAGVVRDGRLYGRGACDMKGGIASAVIALESLIEAGIELPGALEVSGTADEESGGYGGVAWLAKRGFFSAPRVDHVIIPEPFDPGRICIGHRGVWWAEVETLGKSAHGAMPFLGECAVRHMGAFLGRLERQLLPRLAARYTAMPVVPADARHSTLNVAAVHGGLPAHIDGLPSPMVADRCRLLLDRRFLSEEDPAEVRAEVVAILDALAHDRPGFRYKISDLMQVLPTLTPRDDPLVEAVAAAIRRVLGRPPQMVASPGTYDHKHVARIGGLQSCIAYGPGRLEQAHQADEHVEIDDLVAAAQVMAVAALRLLGVEAR